MSFPLDGGLQERCKQAAETQIALQGQILANKRLDFELASLKNCGELMQQGIAIPTHGVLMRDMCRCLSTKCKYNCSTSSFYS